jgi:hypothetical protein
MMLGHSPVFGYRRTSPQIVSVGKARTFERVHNGRPLVFGTPPPERLRNQGNGGEITNDRPPFLSTCYLSQASPIVTVEPGWGSSNASLKLGKKIFAMSIDDELVVKLPKERVDALVAGKARRFDPRRNGKAMKEWLVLPAGDSRWLPLAREAYEFLAGAK